MNTVELFGKEKISRILFRLAPPVMLSKKLPFDCDSDCGAVCTAGIPVLPVGADIFLADLPGDRNHHQYGRRRVLSPVPGKGLCEK